MSQTQPGQEYAYDIHQTHYPYINVKQNLFNQPLADIRRSISSINPFALRQVPSQDRMGFGFRYGNQFYSPNVYPNGIMFTRIFPQHYDPLSKERRPDPTYQDKMYAPAEHGILAITADKLPRACVRSVDKFRRCQWINGAEKCSSESAEIINVCPNWALEEMRDKTRLISKISAIQNNQYKRAMEVSSYNAGRTPADVSDKNWVHGTRNHLRPDTMYPDERYANITQQEINEAKARVAARNAGKTATQEHHAHHHDHAYVEWKSEKPLYP